MLKRIFSVLVGLFMIVSFFSGCVTMVESEVLFSKGKYNEVIPIYKKSLVEDPDNIMFRSKLGFAYLKTGRIDEAVSELETVQRIKPGEAYSALYLGMAYLNKGDLSDAIRIWKGYKNDSAPIVEAEIKRQLTLLLIADSQRQAKKALDTEKKLKTVKPDRYTVAVCYYDDLSPDKSLSAFQKGLAVMVITDMSKIKSLKVVERIRLQSLLEEMQLGQTGIVDASTAPRVGRLLGAENLVVGNIMIGSYTATTSLSSTSAGDVMGTGQVTVPQNQFFELPKSIVTQATDIMGVPLSAQEEAALAVAQTKSFEAVTFFGQALQAMDAGNYGNAKALFAMALAEDPNFVAAQEGLASCPSSSAPSKDALEDMSMSEIADSISAAVESAQDSQGQSDSESDSEGGGGGGGGY